MFTIFIIGAVVVVGAIILALVFLERELAHKTAAGLIALYLSLIGASYFLSQFEKRDASFSADKAEMKLEFQTAKHEMLDSFNGTGDPEEARTGRIQKIEALKIEVADLKKTEAEKVADAKKVSEETKSELDRLKVRAKSAVSSDNSDYLPLAPGASN